jgi:hypothetical protein
VPLFGCPTPIGQVWSPPHPCSTSLTAGDAPLAFLHVPPRTRDVARGRRRGVSKWTATPVWRSLFAPRGGKGYARGSISSPLPIPAGSAPRTGRG